MENKWNVVLLIQPVIGLILILIGIYTFTVGSPELLPWAFMLMWPLFIAMGLYESRKNNRNASLFYHALAVISILFGTYSFSAF